MVAYRVVEGYISIKLQGSESGKEFVKKVPLSRFNIVVDSESDDVLRFLMEELELESFEVHKITKPLFYLPHELN